MKTRYKQITFVINSNLFNNKHDLHNIQVETSSKKRVKSRLKMEGFLFVWENNNKN